jgi:hypothetical protein
MEVPESWTVVTHDTRTETVTMLEGPMIGVEEAHIMIGLRDKMSGEVQRSFVNRMKKEAETVSGQGGSVTIRERGDIQVFDIRRPPEKSANPKEDPMEWRVTILRSSGIGYEQYELKFIGLTVEAYQLNHEWVAKLFETLKFDETDLPPLPGRL